MKLKDHIPRIHIPRIHVPRTLWLAPLAGLLFAASAGAETVRLRTGQTLEGDVTLTPEQVLVDLGPPNGSPEIVRVRIQRSDVDPESLFAIFERRTDKTDPDALLALAKHAEDLGLFDEAIAQYRLVAKIDRTSAREAEKSIRALEESHAAALFSEAKGFFDAGRPNQALIGLHAILETTPKAPSAAKARALLPRAHRAAGASAEVSFTTVAVTVAPKIISDVEKRLAKGDLEIATVRGHEGAGGTAELRAVQRAILSYEDAWRKAKRLPVTAAEEDLEEAIPSLRRRAKASLVRAYVTAGTILVQRRSTASAEKYADKAAELDPEGKAHLELRRLILEAKIAPVTRFTRVG